MRVLYVDHTGHISGAERSLLDLLRGLPPQVEARLACPAAGALAETAVAGGTDVRLIAGTDGSLKLDPIHTPNAIRALGVAAVQTARHAHTFGADALHANSIRAALVCLAAGRLSGVPVIAHIRDRLPRGAVADASLRVIARGASLVIANSAYTAEGLTDVGTPRCDVVVVPNPVDLERFNPATVDRDRIRHSLGIARHGLGMAVVGQITPWKGQEEMVRALIALRERRPQLRLFIVGEAKFVSAATRYDNPAYLSAMSDLVEREGLADQVRFLGERDDIPSVLAAVDMLLVPSWEEPFGRVVIEGMAMGLPVLATNVGGPAEIIRDGHDGMLVRPRDPEAWAAAIDGLCKDEGMRRWLGRNAMARARDFGLPRHVAAVMATYSDVL